MAVAEKKAQDRLLTIGQVAQQLNCGHSTVYNLIHNGHLPFIRLGSKCYRVEPDDLAQFLQDQRSSQASPSTVASPPRQNLKQLIKKR